jgi:hypothetical protein
MTRGSGEHFERVADRSGKSSRRRKASPPASPPNSSGGGNTAGMSAAEASVDESAVRLDYLIEMIHQLKRMARSDGLVHVALLLEMAELEAGDAVQRRRPPIR